MENLDVVERLESNVRSYSRSFPTVFHRARGWLLYDEDGTEYLDFFSGAGALNYGHNHPRLKKRLLEYLNSDGPVHALDMATSAKRHFLVEFQRTILEPRGLDYVVQFPGPTGTNCVEAALKLARKYTGRETIISFTNAFHGMTLGALAVTANPFKRKGAGVPLNHRLLMPFDGYFGPEIDTIDYLGQFVADSGSGIDRPAAVIVETIQGEGGVNVASYDWLARLEHLCREQDMLLIVDDIQVGCGRTGPFFSFEPAGIKPDLVCLSKSLSGYGLPMAVTLIKPELDVWEPGEHNGTFRGNNAAFVTATEALSFWSDDALARESQRKGEFAREVLAGIASEYVDAVTTVRGRGLIQGLAMRDPGLGSLVCRHAFERGLIIESSGPDSNVVKLLPPLTIDTEALGRGLDIIADSVGAALRSTQKQGADHLSETALGAH